MYHITLERNTTQSKFRIGDKVRYKGLKRIGKVIDIEPFDEKSFVYLIQYKIFDKKWIIEDNLEFVEKE